MRSRIFISVPALGALLVAGGAPIGLGPMLPPDTGRIYLAENGKGMDSATTHVNDMIGADLTSKRTASPEVRQFSEPRGVFVDKAGRIYVADFGNNRIVRMNDMTGVGWVALGTTGTGSNEFRGPAGIFVDVRGRIYVADQGNGRIVRVNDMRGAGWAVLGSSGTGVNQFYAPVAISVDVRGRIYVVDGGNGRIVRVNDMTGAGWTSLGTAGHGTHQFYGLSGIFVDGAGRIYVTDSGHRRVVRVNDITGEGWTSLGDEGTGVNRFHAPTGIFVNEVGQIYVTDGASNQILRVNDMTGAGWTTLESPDPRVDQLDGPSGISVDGAGRIYIASHFNDRVVRVNGMTGAGWTSLPVQRSLQASPWIKVYEASWHPRGGFPPRCTTVTPIAFLVTQNFVAFDNVPVESNEGGLVHIELVNCSQALDASSGHLTLTLLHWGDDRPVASVPLPPLSACGGCQSGSPGSIHLLPKGGVEDRVTVYHISSGYYHFSLTGTVQVRGPGFYQEFTPAPGPSDSVLFAGDVRRVVPGTHRMSVASFRGTGVPWDWVDYSVLGAGQVPWMLVDLRAQMPVCNPERDWYVGVDRVNFDAQGQGFRTKVPLSGANTSKDKGEYRWHLMPLPAGTTQVEAAVHLNVHACGGDQPVIAHSVLRVSIPAPPAYRPPTSVSPVHVTGEWKFGQSEANPLYLPLDISDVGGGCSGPIELGSLVCAGVGLVNHAEEPLTVTRPLVMHVEIATGAIDGSRIIIWEGIIPAFVGTLMANGGDAGFSFTWDQHDAAGQQVPPGVYSISIILPIVAHYTLAGRNGEQTLVERAYPGSSSFIIQ